MSRSKKRRALTKLIGKKQGTASQDSIWVDISRRIKMGKVIPIIGSSVRDEHIFDVDYVNDETEGETNESEDASSAIQTVNEELAEIWAVNIGYPFPDRYKLARVAQYNRVKSEDADQAKTRYLSFLKMCLLNLAEADEDFSDLVEELRSQLDGLSFSDIASELDYPRFQAGQQDSLRILARLPLPIYVTTSYYDFLERALQAEHKRPHTQICFWSGVPTNIFPEHRPDPLFVPTVETPLVYHLQGFEKYPPTLVLSEDDYLDFLIEISRDTDSNNPIIPLYLREALAESSLLLLGYRLQDWDFRVLFRGVINAKHSTLRMFSLAIQLNPHEQEGINNSREAQKYLERYFEPARFKVEWDDVDSFINRLWQEWNKWRKGQV